MSLFPSPSARALGVAALALGVAALALALASGLSACGGGDPVGDALAQATVTVTLPQQPAAASASTAPVQPQQAPPAPDGAATDPAAEPDAEAAAPQAGGTAPADAPGAAAPAAEDEGDAAPATDAAPSDPAAPSQTAATQTAANPPTVHLKRATALRSGPGGRVVGRLQPLTEFRSPTVLAVVRRRGDWLSVLTPALPNGRVGWISAHATLETHVTRYRVDASLSRRQVVVRRDGRVVQRFPVAIGSAGTPTPTGRFAVTDKLLTMNDASPYGCCILALTGHQTATPQGWGGGDRIAIHATNLPATIGAAASLGCLRAPTEAIRRVVETVPLGTIVTIKA